MRFYVFFQAEDGIRDLTVTGVQTCALPISLHIILEKGADPNIADADGETPLDWAMHARHEGKIALLRKYSVKVGDTPRDRTYGKPEGIADPRTSLTPRGGRPAASSRSGVPVSTTALATSPAFLTKGEQMANMNCVRRKAGRHRPPRPSSSGPSGETLSAVLRATRNSEGLFAARALRGDRSRLALCGGARSPLFVARSRGAGHH